MLPARGVSSLVCRAATPRPADHCAPQYSSDSNWTLDLHPQRHRAKPGPSEGESVLHHSNTCDCFVRAATDKRAKCLSKAAEMSSFAKVTAKAQTVIPLYMHSSLADGARKSGAAPATTPQKASRATMYHHAAPQKAEAPCVLVSRVNGMFLV